MMDAQMLTTFGGSLLVPRVQELAKQALTDIVPPRYTRPDQRPPLNNSDPVDDFPVIDFNSLVSGDVMDSELDKLHRACKDWGFFQLINHGVSSAVVEKVKEETQEFFNLSLEEKMRFCQLPGDVEGYGQAFVVSEDQKLDWGDMFYVITLPTNLRKPHLFPNLPVSLRDALEDYAVELRNLAMAILGAIAKVLKIEESEMKELFEGGFQGMRLNYYPPCPQPDQVMGLTQHSDGVGLTVLLQVNDMEGLEINKGGEWIPTKPLPGAFVVNIGDILEIVTNGAYRSIEHRVTVNSIKERLSIATFYNPNLEGQICPFPSVLTPHSPARFKSIDVVDYFWGLYSRELAGKSYLQVLRIENGEAQDA